jgi:hypothetical protein
MEELWSRTLHFISQYSFSEVEGAVRSLATVVVKGHRSTIKVTSQTTNFTATKILINIIVSEHW